MPKTTSPARVRALFLLVLLALAAAGCRTRPPLVDPPAIAAAESPTQTRAAILRALSNSRYSVESERPGEIVARHSRSGWTMVVAIDYSNQVSVRYLSSENLQYGTSKGTPVIHPGYNKRVQRLSEVIGAEIASARVSDDLCPCPCPAPPGDAGPQ